VKEVIYALETANKRYAAQPNHLEGENTVERNQAGEERTFVVNIHLTRGVVALLTVALLVVAFMGYLVWGEKEAAASSPQAPLAGATGLRQYYLTQSGYDGADADTACASGYHMASVWEILDPSNLAYDTTLGYSEDDSDQGPPSCTPGWARTGNLSYATGNAGVVNCYAWTSISPSDYGTTIRLPCDWTVSTEVHLWEAAVAGCDDIHRVWCVED
jgi:hypothetical protein